MAAQVVALTRDFDAIVESSALVATDDEHDPEGATIAFERAQVAALLSSAQAQVTDLDQALERLEGGTYGFCDRCGLQIAAERLAALPGAPLCVGCAAAGGHLP